MTDPTHLTEGDYEKLFPAAPDEFPTVVDDQHYIDAWMMNTIFNSLLTTEQYLITHQANIEAPIGDDIIGEEGSLEISIPPARYPSYKTAMAWDSDLLEENIKTGVDIFGVVGSLSGGVGGPVIALPAFAIIAEDIVAISPPALAIDSAVPAISVPTVTSP